MVISNEKIDAVKPFDKIQQYSHDKSSQPTRNAKELPQTDNVYL